MGSRSLGMVQEPQSREKLRKGGGEEKLGIVAIWFMEIRHKLVSLLGVLRGYPLEVQISPTSF